MFSTSLVFVFKTVVVTKPLASHIFLLTALIFFFKLLYLGCIDLCELKYFHQEFFFLSYLLLSQVCLILCF